MGLFSKPEVIILKESDDSKNYLEKLQELLSKASGEVATKIEKEIAVVKAGIVGEENILFELKNSGLNLVVLHDLYLKSASGLTAQIDFLVLTPKLFYVLECKNLIGNIELKNSGEFVRTFQVGNKSFKEGIYSPITQNERHLNVLKECRSENSNFIIKAIQNYNFNSIFQGVVVLANPKTVINDRWAKKEDKEKVIRADQLIKYIKDVNEKSKEFSLSIKELEEIGRRYLEMNNEERPDYFAKYENFVKEVGSKKICPDCGGELILRTAKFGNYAGKKFYGCSNFPKCKYIRNI